MASETRDALGRQTCRVLVVEDDFDTRENLCDILSLDGVVVETAATAAEALRERDWEQILAVVLDRKLPDGTATDLLPRIQRAAPQAEVVVVTGYADLDGAIAALRAGAADYILKPVNPEALRTCLRRIVSRRRSNEALRESEARFHAVFENAVIGVAVCAVEQPFAVLENNALLERMLGYGSGQLKSRPLCGLIHSDDRERCLSICRRLRSQSRPDVQFEARFQCRDSSTVWVEIAGSLVKNSPPGADYLIFFFKDISVEKRAQSALAESENRLRVALKNSSIGVYLQDTELRYTWAYNPSGSLVAENLLGKRDEEVFEPASAERLTQLKRRVLQSGESLRQELPLLMGEGWSYFDFAMEPQHDGQGRTCGITTVAIDVTERKRAEERLLQKERLAAIGETMTGLVHEGRNALQRSKACLEMLALEVEDRPAALDLVARTQHAQEHLQQLYEEVRQYAAPMNLKRQSVELPQIWRESWSHLAHLWQPKQLELQEHCRGDLACEVDPFALGQVFRNLFENAIDASPPAGPLSIAAEEIRSGHAHLVRVAVRDAGPGMGVQSRRRVFEPFFTTKTKGTGLGMAISQRIVESHGGKIVVSDRDGPGAEFVVTLPKGGD